MSDEPSIPILGENIPTSEGRIPIEDLKYNEENPRIYSELEKSKLTQEEGDIQEAIYKIMLKQPSVKNIRQDIKKNGGINEPILITWEKKRVIEGNSRLTVYKEFHKKDPFDEKWQKILYKSVTKLTQEQEDSYLNSIHIKGKTKWPSYEKTNIIYQRYKEGVPIEKLITRFREQKTEILKRIEAIEMMKKNEDSKQSNFSYYDVIRRNKVIHEKIQEDPKLKSFLLNEIKENSNTFSAQDLRNKLPVVLQYKKITKRLSEKKIELNDAYHEQKHNSPDMKLRLALSTIRTIEEKEIGKLSQPELNKSQMALKSLLKEHGRIYKMLKKHKQ